MAKDDEAGTPGEVIGEADEVRLDFRPVEDQDRAKAVLFVTEGFDPGAAIDIQIVKVNHETFKDIVRKRT